MKIKRFNDIQRINETTEFNLQRLGADSAPNAVWSTDNPEMSLGSFDKNQNAITNAIAKVNDILFKLSRSNSLSNLRSKIALENQDITSLTIQRIIKRNSVLYDAYVKFIIEDLEYWGVIYNITARNPEFKSEVFKDHELLQAKEWVVKIKGTVIKTVRNWLKPEPGNYKLINDEVVCYSRETGNMLKMNKDIVVKVIRSYNDEITIQYKNDYYTLVDDNFVYFNWWFEKV